MRTLEQLLDRKLDDETFRHLYERECHVCRFTIRVIERLEQEGGDLDTAATLLGVNGDRLRLLADADYCDPRLVIKLCHHLGLPAPDDCPRLACDNADPPPQL